MAAYRAALQERTRERVKALGEQREGRMAERSGILADGEGLAADSERLEGQLVEVRRQRANLQHELDGIGLRLGSVGREAARLETIATERRVEQAGREEKRERLRVAHERAVSAAQESGEWIARREQEVSGADARRAELAGIIDESQQRLEGRLREEEIARLREEMEDLRRELAEEAEALAEKWTEAAEATEAYLVRPRRSDVGVKFVGLAWLPCWEIGYESARLGPAVDRVPAWDG